MTVVVDKPPTTDERARLFWSQVEVGRVDECWPWTGNVNIAGYGYYWTGHTTTTAHRVAYEALVGPTADHLDHVCHTRDVACPAGTACAHRRCCNPYHLEPVTPEENARRTGERLIACKQGHLYAEVGFYRYGRGRKCRACQTEYQRNARARRRLARAAA